MDPDPDGIEDARRVGVEDAERAVNHAPEDPLLRVAWATGFGREDQVQAAVDRAREAGLTWVKIAEATGEHWRNTQTKYGGGRRRARDYQRRQRRGGTK